jgi:diaminohydroxyphosphoribosylaminopyrimidine deaminase/5-amino-6-(5-phosphoribosylamino)uracil reductase
MTFMEHALRVAEQGRLTCMPNPMVGCVIVKNNEIIGKGAHLKAGCAHAEVNALIQAGSMAVGSDVYVTLEPCSHFGKTPPCVDALIEASVKSVHIAIQDPNPLVAGRSIEKLRAAGIQVFVGENQEEAYQLNKSFFYYITYKKPFVIAKWAMSLDGKIAGGGQKQWGPARWITSDQARTHAHMIRAYVGGIMVGENTVRIDNPELTVRHGMSKSGDLYPRPIVLTVTGALPLESKIFVRGRNTLVMTSHKVCPKFLSFLDKNTIEYRIVSLEKNVLFLPEVIDTIASLGISRLLVEGGSQLLTQFFNYDLVNQLYVYVAPKIIGGGDSLSPIGSGTLFNDMSMNSQEIITLGHDVCFVSETALTPGTYNDFIQRSKNNV